MKIFLSAIMLLGIALLLGLSGCASSQSNPSVPQAGLAPEYGAAADSGTDADPNLVTIHVHRKGSIIGAAVADYWIDWGVGARTSAVLRQFPDSPFTKQTPYDIGFRAGSELNLDVMFSLLQPIARPAKAMDGTWFDLLAVSTPSGRKFLRAARIGQSKPEVLELLLPNWPANVSLAGRVVSGGDMTWRRPPGTLVVDIANISGGSPGFLVRTPFEMKLEPGKTYYINYNSSLRFTVTESPPTN